jgi:hypothetical protein
MNSQDELYETLITEMALEAQLDYTDDFLGHGDGTDEFYRSIMADMKNEEEYKQAELDAMFRDRPNYVAAANLYNKMALEAGRQIQPEELMVEERRATGTRGTLFNETESIFQYQTKDGPAGEFRRWDGGLASTREELEKTLASEDPEIVLSMLRDIARRDMRTKDDRKSRIEAAQRDINESQVDILAFSYDGFKDLNEKAKLSVYNQLRAQKNLDPVDQIPNDAIWKISDIGEVFSEEMYNNPKQYLPFIGSVFTINEMMVNNASVERIQEGTATANDHERVAQMQRKFARDVIGRGAPAGGMKLFADAAPLAVEFLMLSPLAAGRQAAAKTAFMNLANKTAKSTTSAYAKAAVPRFAALTGFQAPSAVANFAEPLRLASMDPDTQELLVGNLQDGDKLPMAITKGMALSGIEVLSEMAGGILGGAAKGLFGVSGRKLASTKAGREVLGWSGWDRIRPQIAKVVADDLAISTKQANKYLEMFGFNGVMGEFLEERLSTAMQAGVGLAEWQEIAPSWRQAMTELFGFGAMQVTGTGIAELNRIDTHFRNAASKAEKKRIRDANLEAKELVFSNPRKAQAWLDSLDPNSPVPRRALRHIKSREAREAYRRAVKFALEVIRTQRQAGKPPQETTDPVDPTDTTPEPPDGNTGPVLPPEPEEIDPDPEPPPTPWPADITRRMENEGIDFEVGEEGVYEIEYDDPDTEKIANAYGGISVPSKGGRRYRRRFEKNKMADILSDVEWVHSEGIKIEDELTDDVDTRLHNYGIFLPEPIIDFNQPGQGHRFYVTTVDRSPANDELASWIMERHPELDDLGAEVYDAGGNRIDIVVPAGVESAYEVAKKLLDAADKIRERNKTVAPPPEPEPDGEPTPDPTPEPVPGQYRQRQDPVQGVQGNTTLIEMVNEKPKPAIYKAVELRSLMPSHDFSDDTARSNEARGLYPPGIQGRDYVPGTPNHQKVIRFAREQKARAYLSNDAFATSGPPTVSANGIVIAGNGRVMSLQYSFNVLKEFDWYRDELMSQAQAYGIEPADIENMEAPVLVRVVDMNEIEAETRRWADATNTAATFRDSPIRQAYAARHILTSNFLEILNLRTGDIKISTEASVAEDLPEKQSDEIAKAMKAAGASKKGNGWKWNGDIRRKILKELAGQDVSDATAAVDLNEALEKRGVILEEVATYKGETFSEVVTQDRGEAFREALYDSLPQEVRAAYFGENLKLTNAGIELVRNMLLLKVLPIEVVERLETELLSFKLTLEEALPSLLLMRSEFPEYDITPDLAESVLFVLNHPEIKTPKALRDEIRAQAEQSSFWVGDNIADSFDAAGMMILEFVYANKNKRQVFRAKLGEFIAEVEGQEGLFGGHMDSVALRNRFAEIFGVPVYEGAVFKSRQRGSNSTEGIEYKPKSNPATLGSENEVGAGPVGSNWDQGRVIKIDRNITGREAKNRGLSEHTIIATMARLFNVPIRIGFVRQIMKGAAGIYRVNEHVIRFLESFSGNLGVAIHEVAHSYDFGLAPGKRPYDNAPEIVKQQLMELDYKPGGMRIYEGFAEFIRAAYVVKNTHELDIDATVNWWFKEYLPKHPATRSRFEKIAEMITQWQTQTAEERAASNIVSREDVFEPDIEIRKKVLDAAFAGINKLHTQLLDEFHYAELFDKRARQLGLNLPEGEGFYDILSVTAQIGPTWAMRALREGVFEVTAGRLFTPVAGERINLIDEIVSLGDNYLEFITFLHARHAKEVWVEKNIHPGMEPLEADAILKKHKHNAQFHKVAEKVSKFNNQMVDMLANAGVITHQEAARITGSYETYIPLFRNRQSGGLGQAQLFGTKMFGMASRKLFDSSKPIKARSGSAEQIIDPLEATVEYAIRFYTRAARQQALQAAVQIAVEAGDVNLRDESRQNMQKMGEYLEVLPTKIKATQFAMKEIWKQLDEMDVLSEEMHWARTLERLRQEDAPIDKLYDYFMERSEDGGALWDQMLEWFEIDKGHPPDEDDLVELKRRFIRTVADEIAQQQITIWRPNYNTPAGEPISRVILNGGIHFIQWHPELFKMVEGMEAPEYSSFWRILGAATGAVKFGATGFNPFFAIRNTLRDVQVYAIQSKAKFGTHTFTDPWEMVGSYIAATMGGGSESTNAILIQLWQDMGGELSQLLGRDRQSISRFLNEVLPSRRKRDRFRIVTTPIEAMRQLVNISEVGPRLAEFRAALSEATMETDGWEMRNLTEKGIRPPRHLLIRAVNRAHNVTTNFKRMGVYGRLLNKSVPFFNASLQGTNQMVRTWKDHPTRAAIGAATLAGTTLMYWLSVKDEDWYKEQPAWLKYGFWTIAGPDGAPVMRIPRGFEWGYLFAGGMEMMLESYERREGRAFTSWLRESVDAVRPPLDMSLVTPIIETAMDYDFFRGAAIVGENMRNRLKPEDQYHVYTTDLAVAMGKMFNYSPARLEHLIQGLTGGLYGNIIRTYELGASVSQADWKNVNAADIPPIGGLLLRKDYTHSIDDFYSRLQDLTQASGSDEKHNRVDYLTETEVRRFSTSRQLMSELRKLMPDVKSREKRFGVEKYMVGLARFALGRDELGRYPNPLTDKDLPSDIRKVVDNWLGLRIETLAKNPPTATVKEYHKRLSDWKHDVAAARDIVAELDLNAGQIYQLLLKRGAANPSEKMTKAISKLWAAKKNPD